jgi:putative addiction module component (TIGR02574 family)
MDLPSVLREVDAWPVEDRMLLVQQLWDRLVDQGYEPGIWKDLRDELQQLWDRLVDQGYEPEIWEDLRDELNRRVAADEAAPDEVVSWEEVKAEALKRTRR